MKKMKHDTRVNTKKFVLTFLMSIFITINAFAPKMVQAATSSTIVRNVYGATIDIQNAQRILGTTNGKTTYKYILTDTSTFKMPTTFTPNDILVGGIASKSIVSDAQANGAFRIIGADRYATCDIIRQYAIQYAGAGKKNVYGTQTDITTAQTILGSNYFKYTTVYSSNGITMLSDTKTPLSSSALTANDIVLGGSNPNVTGISDDKLNGATRLWGKDRDATKQAIKNYYKPICVYGNSTDIATAKKILGTEEYDYIIVVPGKTVVSNTDIVVGGSGATGGIPDANLNGATRLCGQDANATAQVIRNYSGFVTNVYGTSIDIQNAQRILGTTSYNYIQTDISTFIMPTKFNKNDILVGGIASTVSDAQANGASRIPAGSDRYITANNIRAFAGTKNVYGTQTDITNAQSILGFSGYHYITVYSSNGIAMLSATKTPLPSSALTANDIVLGGPDLTVTGISDNKLNGATRLYGPYAKDTEQAVNNYKTPKNVYGNSTDIATAKNILGTAGYIYTIVVPGSTTVSYNDIVVGGAGAIGGITDANLNGATRLWGLNSDATRQAIINYITAFNVYGASVDIQNAKGILGTTNYNYIDLSRIDITQVVFTANDIVLGGPVATKISDDRLNGAKRIAGQNRYETIQGIKNYKGFTNLQHNDYGSINTNSVDVPIIDDNNNIVNIPINTTVQVNSTSGDNLYYYCYCSYLGKEVKILKMYLTLYTPTPTPTPTPAPAPNNSSDYWTQAKWAAAQLGWNAEFIYAQWEFETGYFKSANLINNNNIAGQTWYPALGESRKGTPRPANEGGYYIKYDNAAQGYVDFVQHNSRYNNVASSKDPEQEARTIEGDGWCATSGYANAIISIIRSNIKLGYIS